MRLLYKSFKKKCGSAFILILFFVLADKAFSQSYPASRPNIILIIADDLGYSYLASYGNKFIQTPNIDGLSKNGVRFTQAYVSAPICAPSREGILTGRYQQRFGDEFMPYENLEPAYMKNFRRHFNSLKHTTYPGLENVKPKLFVNRKNFNNGLPATEITIAQLLKQTGYTTGLIGHIYKGYG